MSEQSRSLSRSPMVSPQCSPQTSRKQTNLKSGPTLPSTTAPPPPIPPRRISPTNTPVQSPTKTIRITNNLSSIKSNNEKFNENTTQSKAKKEHKSTIDNRSTKMSHLTTHILNPSFGTWPGAANTALPLNNQSGVSQSAGTSPTNIIISSPLIPRHPPPLPSQKPIETKHISSTNSLSITAPFNSIELNDLIEEHSYANTELNGSRRNESEPIQGPSLSPTSSSSSSPSSISSKSDKKIRSSIRPLGMSLLENKENDRVSYVNLHMDYISQLISEGYCQESVIRALGIAKNDLQMARDILHEFVTKRNLSN